MIERAQINDNQTFKYKVNSKFISEKENQATVKFVFDFTQSDTDRTKSTTNRGRKMCEAQLRSGSGMKQQI
ncbi:hypothetical protein [Clostridium sp.]|uniref:hypothetical protein n=1 Tax=Clostridium sp. TaxID=1506 RepID=UPI003216A738